MIQKKLKWKKLRGIFLKENIEAKIIMEARDH
jgi:hypothetical protein